MATRGVTQSNIQKRREYAVNLKLAGLSIDTILKQVNGKDPVELWGVISRQALEKDIAEYFRRNKAGSLENFDHADRMREAHIAQMEKVIERLAIHIAQTKKWKSFEYADALEKLMKMQNTIVEIQNWNLGRLNPSVVIHQTNIQQVFESASIHNKKTPNKLKVELIQMLSDIKDELKSKDIGLEQGEVTKIIEVEVSKKVMAVGVSKEIDKKEPVKITTLMVLPAKAPSVTPDVKHAL